MGPAAESVGAESSGCVGPEPRQLYAGLSLPLPPVPAMMGEEEGARGVALRTSLTGGCHLVLSEPLWQKEESGRMEAPGH